MERSRPQLCVGRGLLRIARPVTAVARSRDRDELHARYRDVRDHTEALAAPLSPEDQVVQSMPDVSPTKWHRAHTTWFFETFLLEASLPDYEPFDPAYAYLFNSYYEAVGPRHPRPHRGLLSRPSVDDIAQYRIHVDKAMHDLIVECDDQAAALIELGLNHEQQHQELLLMDIKHVLHCNPTQPAYAMRDTPRRAPSPLDLLDVSGGPVEVGHDGRGFAFDNESPRHIAHLEPFRIADRLVNASEWLEFIDDDGYRRPDLWLADGWAAVQEHDWQAPLYWHDDGDGAWVVFTLAGPRPLDPNEPVVHVSHYEADAFARWRGVRLPTEFEWEHAVNALPHGALREVDTDAWQWTASAYLPYPRFQPAAGAVGEYNGKFMSGQMTLRGGARVTPSGHTRPTYRNFFPPGSRWMYGGVRVASDIV
jgi:ergothioneine biosynthesis protein EgtB